MSNYLENFLKFDWIIFVMAIVNGVIFFFAFTKAKKLYDTVAPRISLADDNPDLLLSESKSAGEYGNVYELWKKVEFFYTLFINLSSIFTLLGILGTVVSLLGIVEDMSAIDVEFLGALTSTFWGIIFTILFKVLDSCIAYYLDMGERLMEIIQNKAYGKAKATEESNCEETKS